MYFAIVTKGVGENDPTKTRRWAFTGTDKDALIKEAVEERWKSESQGYGPYRIFVGKLSSEIVTPTEYKEIRLKGAR